MRTLVLVAALLAVPARAENAQLQRAIAAVNELRYAEAVKALDAAWKTADNDRATVLKILELTGVVHATLHNQARADDAFRLLFALAPDFKLEKELGPRVMTPFFLAKSWVEARGAVTLTPVLPSVEGDDIVQLGVKLVDPMKVARTVRFHVRQGSEPWKVLKADGRGGAHSVTVRAPRVEWWAEALGDRGAQLVLLGSEAAPMLNLAKPPAPPPPADVPVATSVVPEGPPPTPPPEVTAPPPTSPRFRPAAYTLAGLGAAAGIVGAVFGVRAQSARSELAAATYDMDGRVLMPTQARAATLEQQLAMSAPVSYALYTVAGALVLVGVILWIVGS